ncbi:histone-lysine N-methyltransferase, H3 lysine-36 specific-like [Helicoverpa armigera]|uniref:histone-lysine N-methyltransferase, H3 lysine-36 specific-like n=1 Tax=Helicoverpa armigera TaxID=29058 RepID=UPI003082EFA9
MEESEDNMSSEDLKVSGSPLTVKSKPKKRSLIERELETNLTARVTSPVSTGDGTSTSRYGRARRLKSEIEHSDTKKVTPEIKSPLAEKSPMKTQSPVYKMHASNSPLRSEQPKIVGVETFLENQIESIYQENISLSRFATEEVKKTSPSPAKKFPKVYIRKDLIQKREADENVMFIKNMFSPVKSASKSSSTHLNNILERSSERYSLGSAKQQNGYIDNSSVVKTLDFDSKKKKKDHRETKTPSKSELFELEAKCAYQVGDLAWARMGTFPFWPCIVTRDPSNGVFVKKKLFGRIERDVIHVTFFGDNGRRGWIVDTMLRKYSGQLEFENTRENFTPEDKKKDPRLYAAFFVSEKKQALWNNSVEEAEMLLREPKRLRIDIFNEMLEKSRAQVKQQKSGKISRTDSDVSLSESLYDTLFSEDDGKTDTAERSRNRTRNKSLDVFEVVTACLDNMAAKTGITKIQRQSHMDRWLQKAKSKTPEKTQSKTQVPQLKLEEKKDTKETRSKKKKKNLSLTKINKPYSLRKSLNESPNLSSQNEHDYTNNVVEVTDSDQNSTDTDSSKNLNVQNCTEISDIAVTEKNEETKSSEEISDKESPKETVTTLNGTHDSESEHTDDNSQDSKSFLSTIDPVNNKTEIEEPLPNVTKINETQLTQDDTTEDSESEPESPVFEDLFSDDSQDRKLKLTKMLAQVLETEKLNLGTISTTLETQPLPKANENVTEKTFEVNSAENTDEPMSQVYEDSYDENSQESKNTEIEATKPQENEDNSSEAARIEKEVVPKETVNEVIEQSNEITDKSPNIDTTDLPISQVYEDSYSQDAQDLPISQVYEDPDSQGVQNLPISQVYEDSYSQDALDSKLMANYESEDNMSTSNAENISADLQDELTNDSTAVSTEPSFMSVDIDTDSDYKPDCSTESDSLSEGSLINESMELEISRKNSTDKDSVPDKTAKSAKKSKKSNKISKYLKNNLDNDNHDNFATKRSNKESNNQFNDKNNVSKINDRYNEVHNRDVVDSIKNVSMNGHVNVKEIDMENGKELHLPSPMPATIVENGFHDVNGDLDTISVHSEDSTASSKSEKRRLRSRQDKTAGNPLENPEFLKYLELRQDAIMDENPELTQDEIVAYLHKTWVYEENAKTDDKKNDDLRESTLVKGLNLDPAPKQKDKKVEQPKHKKSQKNTSNSKTFMQRFLLRQRAERKRYIEDESSQDDQMSNTDEELTNNNSKSERSITPKVVQNDLQTNETEIALGSTSNSEVKDNNISIDTQINKNDTEVATAISKEQDKENKDNPKPIDPSNAIQVNFPQEKETANTKDDFDRESIDSEDSEAPLIRCKLRSKSRKENIFKDEVKIKEEEADTISITSEGSEVSLSKRKKKFPPKKENALEDPEFVKYMEVRQDSLIEENPQLTQDEIISYLYKTWLYEEEGKSEIKKNDDIEQSGLVKGLKDATQQPKKIKRKVKTEKEETGTEKDTDDDVATKDKPRRKVIKPYYNEEYSDIEEELEVFSIFNDKRKSDENGVDSEPIHEVNDIDEVELYFQELAKPKPNVFKGLIREKVCEMCEMTGNLVKCKGCNGMFHVDCVNKEVVEVETPAPTRGRKKKKKLVRKPKNSDDFDNHDDKSQDVSEENASMEEIIEPETLAVDAETLEAQIEAKMKELLESEKIDYDSYSSDDGCDWSDTVPGKCEIIDVKLKPRRSNSEMDYSNFKCKNCQKYDTPVCFVCKSAVSKNEATLRQRCHVAHCHKYYHLQCLEHWPQTQFNGGEPSKTNKKINEYFEALTCPRHVCHTCVSDDPRGCKTRFSGDKLARCVRCPATYHSFTRCLPAGTQILTASHIICPRHYEHTPGKVPCHVNTGWCFICALGGSLICCEYCPTSFHAECLNIKPPEGGYMCEDCETGRLPLYGEMVWVKLGHYRWWPGIVLHPSEIPENIMAVKHNLGEFVVRFFGQYDHYWVNRGRVFPFQEGDSGRISYQKSKIDAAFTTAMEHAQRACEILKSAQPNEEESLDIASSLLPPHYVKLKVNKPCGSLCGRRLEDPESSLTQCECNPNDEDVCGLYSHCLNRMLLTECGPTCRAGDRCNNRAFEKRQYPKLVPYRTPSRGWGLKTLEDIKAGQFVIEYVGELIDEEEFRRRMRRKHEIRDENFYFLTLDKERMIDAGPKGNLARFMNHCCEPNCETQKWTVLGDVRVGLFALYDIPANSEVTFNYNLECAGIEKKRCMCGATRCAGYIGAKPKQDESQSKKPKIPGKRTYKKRKTTEESPSTKNKPKRPIGRPPKPRELTEIEKDLLIIRNATNGISSDESSRSMSSEYERNPKALKRKRVSFSTEENVCDGSESPSVKKTKLEEKTDVGD